MDEGTIKTPNPKCRLYWWFNRVYRSGDTVSHVGIFDPSCELLPIYLLSDLPHPFTPPLPKVNVQYIQTVAVGGGGVELCCRPYSAGIEHSVVFSDQTQNLQNCYNIPDKNTSKDDI
jgi:hypothetical protein